MESAGRIWARTPARAALDRVGGETRLERMRFFRRRAAAGATTASGAVARCRRCAAWSSCKVSWVRILSADARSAARLDKVAARARGSESGHGDIEAVAEAEAAMNGTAYDRREGVNKIKYAKRHCYCEGALK